MEFVTLFAAEAAAGKQGLFEALGLNVQQLLINSVAFLILVAILARFVYPTLIKSIENRRSTIEAGLEEAKKSQEASEEAEKRIEALLADARKDADEIVARSHTEAMTMVADAETKAKQRAEQVVADARAQLDAEVTKARAALKKDTLKLVALATEKIVDEKLDATKDAKLIESAISAENRNSKGRA
jgi:F-type H+-transporting ATPase subunit b